MHPLLLRALFRFDQVRFALFCAQWRHALQIDHPVSPNLRYTRLHVEPGGVWRLGRGVATERRRGNEVLIERGGQLTLGERVWLRTQHETNRITVFAGARIEIGDDTLVNGAMLHAKREITIGRNALIGFGARVIDADLHDLDSETPERVAPVKIGDRVWIGADTVVLRGVSIGDDSVVGAGSIVTRDLPSRVLALGSPARVVREIAPR
jgi:carbonic anhydrase/acetyltransferase-like protein (isoleucine patch superfamily)